MNKQQYEKLLNNAFKLNDDLPEAFQIKILEEGIRELQSRPAEKIDRKILLIGGAGYIGSVLTKHLLDCDYSVRCLDMLLYGNNQCVTPFLSHDRYEFIYGDFTDNNILSAGLKNVTDVVILAGLVGDPITKKYPDIADKINQQGMIKLINQLNNLKLNKVIFISTCSNYGIVDHDSLADEKTALLPLSKYSQAKVEVEQYLLSLRGKVDYHPTILRFATAFGLSPRMRFDLTVNQFVLELSSGNNVLVYDPETWRPYCHVKDFSSIVRRVLESPLALVDFEIFNAGGEVNNYNKRMIVEAIQQYIPASKVSYQDKGPDPRNYRVNFKKIKNTLNFTPKYTVIDGIKELLQALDQKIFNDALQYKNFHENHEIIYPI